MPEPLDEDAQAAILAIRVACRTLSARIRIHQDPKFRQQCADELCRANAADPCDGIFFLEEIVARALNKNRPGVPHAVVYLDPKVEPRDVASGVDPDIGICCVDFCGPDGTIQSQEAHDTPVDAGNRVAGFLKTKGMIWKR